MPKESIVLRNRKRSNNNHNSICTALSNKVGKDITKNSWTDKNEHKEDWRKDDFVEKKKLDIEDTKENRKLGKTGKCMIMYVNHKSQRVKRCFSPYRHWKHFIEWGCVHRSGCCNPACRIRIWERRKDGLCMMGYGRGPLGKIHRCFGCNMRDEFGLKIRKPSKKRKKRRSEKKKKLPTPPPPPRIEIPRFDPNYYDNYHCNQYYNNYNNNNNNNMQDYSRNYLYPPQHQQRQHHRIDEPTDFQSNNIQGDGFFSQIPSPTCLVQKQQQQQYNDNVCYTTSRSSCNRQQQGLYGGSQQQQPQEEEEEEIEDLEDMLLFSTPEEKDDGSLFDMNKLFTVFDENPFYDKDLDPCGIYCEEITF